MKVVVTGGCGFIGSHVVDALIKKGHEVCVFDDMSTGSIENLNNKAFLRTGDLVNRTDLDGFFRLEKPDVVVHHAAQIDVQASMKNPSYDANINIMGTVNLLDMCIKYKVKRFLYASSAAIYGNPEYLGVDEEHPKSPESFYGFSKLVPETYIRMYSENFGLSYAILRYANVYGPRQKAKGEGGVVAIFSNNMNRDLKCIIYGDGEQTRDFVYVKDVAKANVLALESKKNFTANVSTAKATSVNELFAEMKDKFGFKSMPEYMAARPGDIGHSWLTNGKIYDMTGWVPEYTLQQGILDMVNSK